ncbi:hypothetical protein VPH35_031145 [Triticum aestivum]
MHDETATTKTKTSTPYLPDELVSEILPRIPLEPLLRFRSVCKAWRGIIDEDSFHQEHLRHQTSSLLVTPWIGENDDDGPFASSTGEVTAAGFYQWDGKQQDAATLVHAMPDYHNKMEALHSMAHCDGLVLLPADDTVHVVNPATRRTIALPPTPNAVFQGPHQVFGLGHDPRSNTYKVARLYVHRDRCTPGGDTVRMGVCTIGKGLCWRDAAVSPPPHHFMPRRTATFFKGSLLWIVKQVVPHGSPAAPSFIRFRLEDESFKIVRAPPCTPRLDYKASSLTELRGELCVCAPRVAYDHVVFEMWMCGDLDDGVNPPRWDLRHVITGPFLFRSFIPKITTADAVVFHFQEDSLYYCNLQTPVFNMKDVIEMGHLRYHHLVTDKFVEYTRKIVANFYVTSYVPSLVRI